MVRTSARDPLTPERIIAAAVRHADEHGIATLTMRSLGQALHVEAMSIYHHVANKEAVLDGMVDAVFAEIEMPTPGEPWRAAMRRRAESVRDALVRHPWAIGLLGARANPGPATLRHHDAVLGCLREGGFDVALAAHAFSVLDCYIFGFALQQVNLPFRTPDELQSLTNDILDGLNAGALGGGATYPWLTESALDHASREGWVYADEFGWGLDLVLDGLERTLRARRRG